MFNHKQSLYFAVIAAVLLLTACGTSKEKPVIALSESERLNVFFEEVFQGELARSPMQQSYLGIKDDYDKWDDMSDAKAAEDLAIKKRDLNRMRNSFEFEKLDAQAKLSYRLFEKEVADAVEGWRWRHHDYPVNQMYGVHSQVPSFLINIHRVDNVSDAEAYIARLKAVPALLEQLIDNLKIRAAKDIMPPQFVFPYAVQDIKNIITGIPFDQSETKSPIYEDFVKKIDALEIQPEQKNQLETRAQEALLSSLKPAYEKLLGVLQQQMMQASTDAGVWKLPDGEDFYAYRLRRVTTTDMSADYIHQYGLAEVARIHDEMRAIMKKVGFKGTLQAFFKFMRTDKQFYYPNSEAGREAYLQRSVEIVEDMKKRLDDVFLTKPKADIVVKPVEAFREKSAGWAFYQRPAPDGSRPGTFYINLYRMEDNPTYSAEALAYHEGIPGHHMQIAIAQELENIPKFRKYGGYTAYIEGWGLYSELLPKEMGFYQDPYADFGRLDMELWRAIRLVVDTGIHAKKWTREQTIDYHLKNASRGEDQAVKATERYIVMPGQATAYKVGMRKLLQLREYAQRALGAQFDLREYHDVILTDGALPLSILQENVEHWVASKQES